MGGHRGPWAPDSGVMVLDLIQKSHLLQESPCLLTLDWRGPSGSQEASGKCWPGQGVSTIEVETEDGWERNLGG